MRSSWKPKRIVAATVPAPVRRRDARLNREQILSSALRQPTANPEASIDEIARAAGVARRTVYGHFASREALLEALVENSADGLGRVARVAAEAGLADGDPAVTLARFTLGELGTEGSLPRTRSIRQRPATAPSRGS